MGKFDFSGWATRANLRCSDGRTISPDAFKHMDGKVVPLIWNHRHDDPNEILGQALLEHREGQGVYAWCSFNDTESGKTAKLIVQHGDINALSIYANNLKEHMSYVTHGNIREVSLVLAGANPGASIQEVVCHSDTGDIEKTIIFTGEEFELYHADADDEENVIENEKEDEPVAGQVNEELNETQKNTVKSMIDEALKDKEEAAIEHADKAAEGESKDDSEETVADVFNTLNDKQKTVVYALIGQALEDAADDEDEESKGGNKDMKHNVFDQEEMMEENVLSHSEMTAILDEARTSKSSLKDTCLAHGITDIEVMFPDHKSVSNEPEFIKRDDDWVAKVLGGIHHVPFTRIKTIFADITANEARAKGYQKGNLKIEEVFKLLKRVTNPTTVYKKQKLDRDDVLDITDFNILPWLKKELRMMLNEEMARAFLIGDGRDPVDEADDKINEECIRPIWKMEDLFTVKVAVSVPTGANEADRAKAFIKAVVKSRKEYKGSGNPAMFMPEDLLTECLLLEDNNGRVIYDTEEKLRARLRVSEIIPVPVMEGDAIKRTDDEGKNFELAGLYVNLKDYNVGTDKGGEINFFDDFDIDYNQMKYLMETRCSGTLIKPYSAVAIEFTDSTQG